MGREKDRQVMKLQGATKDIYPKYSTYWPYLLTFTIMDCGCSIVLDNGLDFKFSLMSKPF